jgi:hypothetical protein
MAVGWGAKSQFNHAQTSHSTAEVLEVLCNHLLISVELKKTITNTDVWLSTANGAIHALDRKGPESGENGGIAVKE